VAASGNNNAHSRAFLKTISQANGDGDGNNITWYLASKALQCRVIDSSATSQWQKCHYNNGYSQPVGLDFLNEFTAATAIATATPGSKQAS